MKPSVTIGLLLSAGWLFALLPRTDAQDDQALKYRRAQAQTTPSGAPARALSNGPGRPVFRPQLSSPLSPAMRSPQMVPMRQVATPLPTSTARLKQKGQSSRQSAESAHQAVTRAPVERAVPGNRRTGSVPASSPSRQSSRKTARKKDDRTQSRERKEEAERNPAAERTAKPSPAAATRPETEGTILVPMHSLPMAPAAPPPQAAPAFAPPPPTVAPPEVERQAQVQSPQSPQTTPVHSQRPVLNALSQDERAKLHSAHQTALHDPNLAASRARYLNARKEFRDKLRDALLKADPSVQPILEKIRQEKPDEH
ncbi:MAG: hypothetical protein DLM52_03795 [Chthoniobacterales bacterium]|nr:MAG: hypothetical protein DLM52_03795 [Chthoniobacterales bacterium]